MARPTKLTPELHKKVVAYIQAGAYVEVAVAACGISKSTFYEWLRLGSARTSGLHREFSDAVEKAQAEAEMLDVNRISKAAAEGNWQAAAWRLERKFPDRWGRRDMHKLEHSGPGGKPIEIVTPKAFEEAAAKLLESACEGTSSEDFDGRE